jgi:hypothetical protein
VSEKIELGPVSSVFADTTCHPWKLSGEKEVQITEMLLERFRDTRVYEKDAVDKSVYTTGLRLPWCHEESMGRRPFGEVRDAVTWEKKMIANRGNQLGGGEGDGKEKEMMMGRSGSLSFDEHGLML